MKKLFIFLSLGFLLFFGIVNSAINVSAYTDNEYDVTINTMINASSLDKVVIKEQYGALITPFSSGAPENHKFAFWIINGVVRYDLDFDYEFLVNSNLEITGVFEPSDDSEHAVLFIDSNGKLIKTHYVPTGEDITTLPNIDGYTKPHYVVAETPWKEANKSPAVFTNITESKVFVLQYKLDGTVAPVIITVNGVDTEYAYNEIVTLNADSENFSHWEDDGVIVSYNPTYTFTAIADRTIEAKESGSSSTPLVTLQNVTGIREGYKSFLGQVYLPDGYTLIETGILASNEEKVLFLDSTDTEVIKSNSILETTNEFLRSFPEASFTTFRAYVVVKSGEEIEVIYSENNFYSMSEYISEDYVEVFDNANLTSNYLDGSFTGVNGVKWTYGHSRDVENTPINGNGIMLRRASDSYIEATIEGGIDRLSFNYRKAFTGTSARQLEITLSYGNGLEKIYLTDIFGTTEPDNTIYNFSKDNIGISGEFTLRIKNIGDTATNRQTVIDNISWTELSQDAFDTKLYNVEFENNGLSTNIFIRLGNAIQAPETPTKEGYSFVGWFDENDNEFDLNTAVTKHIKLYSKFNINQYTLSFDTNGGSTVESITANYNTPIVPPSNPTKEGYTFSGWNQELPAHMPASNVTYNAVWTPNQYTISLESNGGSLVDPIIADYQSIVSAPEIPTKDGKFFAGWFTDIALTNPYTFTTMPLNGITLYAKWEDSISLVTVEFDFNNGGEVLVVQITLGNTVSKPTDPTKEGHTFAGWFTDNSTFNNKWNFDNPVNENIKLYAKWEISLKTASIISAGKLTTNVANNENLISNNKANVTNNGPATISLIYVQNNASTHSIFNNDSKEIRLYPQNSTSTNGGQLNISVSTGFVITSIEVKTSQNPSILSINGSGGISGSPKQLIDNLSQVTLKNIATGTGTSNQVRITEIVITYIPG